MPVLLGHHGRGKILSWTWRYPTTAVVTSLHGRGDLKIAFFPCVEDNDLHPYL